MHVTKLNFLIGSVYFHKATFQFMCPFYNKAKGLKMPKRYAKCELLSAVFRLTPCCSLVGVWSACPDSDRKVLAGWRAEVMAQQVLSGIAAGPHGIRYPSLTVVRKIELQF